MNRRTKALAITAKVKKAVEFRDLGLCVFCGKPGRGEAHYISRAQSGLGIEENLLTVCRECHYKLDQTVARRQMLLVAREYLDMFYPDFPDEQRKYQK